jgi:tRNA dimethylallyltransferase
VSAPKTIVLISGPTGVGKTALALALAESLNTSIISADSRQCYRELNIGVARPSPEELARVPHYFIATHSIREVVNTGTFARYAADAAREIFAKVNTLVLAGGTGLYIKAFTEGIDEMPEIPDETRRMVREGYAQHGLR